MSARPSAAQSRKRPTLALLRLRPSTSGVDTKILAALAILLLLTQLPHVLHLPIWITVTGVALVAARLLASQRPELTWLDLILSSVVLTSFAVVVAILIRLHFGYFVGRDPAVAFLFVLVAAKFAELRRGSDATVLMCLASFLLLTQYFYSQTLLAALVTVPAVFALGHALAVIRDPDNAAPLKSNIKLVAVMLLQGAPLAILLFFVFPRLSGPLWSLPEDGMAQSGLSDSMRPGSIGELSQSSAVAFRVEFDSEVPPYRQRYWRGPVFEQFDGYRWSPSHTARPVKTQPSDSNTDVIDYTVMLQPHKQQWMFALETPTRLPTGSDAPDASRRPLALLLSDGQLIADDPINQVTRYRQSSSLSDSQPAPRGPGTHTLQLPSNNAQAIAFGKQLALQHSTPHAIASALMQGFSKAPFRYTLRPALLGNAPVDEFLFDTREGFCEHYASAFAVVMRAAGIPARIVTGYLGGEMNGDYMIVRQSDAHAWAELWIDGVWKRYDPTAAIAPSRVENGIGTALGVDEPVPALARLGGGWVTMMQLRWDGMNHAWQRLVVDFDNDSQAELWDRLGLRTPEPWQITAVVLTASALWMSLLLGLPGIKRLHRFRAERELPPAERAWRQLERLLARKGLARVTGETPSDWLARISARRPDLAPTLRRLSEAFNRQRFARCDNTSGALALAHDFSTLRRLLRKPHHPTSAKRAKQRATS